MEADEIDRAGIQEISCGVRINPDGDPDNGDGVNPG